MPTSTRTDPGNEGQALGADITPEMDAFGRRWAFQDAISRGYDPQLMARVFQQPPPAAPDNNPPPQVGPNLDAARAAAGSINEKPPESISRNEGSPNLEAARAAATGDTDSDPLKHPTYLGRMRDIPADIGQAFREPVEDIKRRREARHAGQGPQDKWGKVKEFAGIVGDIGQIAVSPLTGVTKAMAARPAAERVDIERKDQPGEHKFGELLGGREATPHLQATIHEPEPASEEKVQKFTDALSFVMPGTGLIRYGQLARGALASQSAQRISRFISPGAAGSAGEPAAAVLRQAGGMAARDTEVTRVELEQHQRALRAIPEPQRLAFMAHAIEGGPTTIRAIGSAPLRNLATEIRRQMQIREGHLRQLPSTSRADYIDNYFPHMWQDPNRATNVFGAGGPGRTGSAASLQARSIPSISDGLAQGLVPVTNDPLDMVMRYVQSIDKFIYFEAARDAAIHNGEAMWVRPHTVGASGHPMGYNAPDGWTKLAGRGASRADGAQLYAPNDFATVWNRALSQGASGPLSRPLVEAAHQASNFVTMAELSLSAFHAFTMGTESAMSEAASALSNIVGGTRNRNWRQLMRGAGEAAGAAAGAATIGVSSLARDIYRGRQFERAYLGLSPGSPDMNRMINRMERAGGRATGSRHANIQSTPYMNFWQALRRGALRTQARLDLADIRANPALGIPRVLMRTLARFMDTISHPLFNVAIPKIKNSAFMREAATWVRNHPNASQAELDRGMRMVWDSIDNRFGELVQDNIFWDARLKQAAQIMMRSYSWNLGTIREIGGGALDLARGRGPLESTRAAYVLVMPVVFATMNAVYQYLMTGQGPQDMDDLIAPRTGGTVQGPAVPSLKPFGRSQTNEVPERAQLPGYAKDVFGWYFDPAQEAINKIATGPRSALQLGMNRDYRDLPIFDPNGSPPEWLKQFVKYASETYGPISFRQKQKEGSKVGWLQGKMGIRPATGALQDTESYEEAKRRRGTLNWKRKQNVDKRQQQQYGGTSEE